MFTPRARITPWKAFRSAPWPTAWAYESRLSVIPRTTPRARCSNPSARRRMPEPRFLVVRLGSLGDIVHTFPAVASLREIFPNAEIIWLTHPRWETLVASSSLASYIWPVETRSFSSLRKTIHRLRTANFDAAIDFQGLWKSASLPWLGGVAKRIGFSSQSIREPGVPI